MGPQDAISDGPIVDAQRDPRMRYSVDWFINATEGRRRSPRESTEQLWDRCLKTIEPRPRRICEVGICEGRSTFWLLQNLEPELYVGIDPWIPDRRWHAEQYVQWRANFWHNIETLAGCAVSRAAARGTIAVGKTSCTIIEQPSDIYLRAGIDADFPGQPFDLVYVDGGHDTFSAMLDMIYLFRKLKVGGLMIVDDTDRRWHNARPSVLEAMQAFWMLVEHNVERLAITDATKRGALNRRQWWLRKFRD